MAEAPPPDSALMMGFLPSIGFVMDTIKVVPQLMALGSEFLTGTFLMIITVGIPVVSWAVIQSLIWILRRLAKQIRWPAVS